MKYENLSDAVIYEIEKLPVNENIKTWVSMCYAMVVSGAISPPEDLAYSKHRELVDAQLEHAQKHPMGKLMLEYMAYRIFNVPMAWTQEELEIEVHNLIDKFTIHLYKKYRN